MLPIPLGERLLRFAVAGLGKRGSEYTAELLKTRNVEVSCAIDVDERARVKFRQRFPSIPTHCRIEDALQVSHFDCLIVSTPTDSHCPIAQRGLAYGCHVLCEKPLGQTLAECQKLEESAIASRRVVACGYQTHLFPRTHWLRRAVSAGRLGRAPLLHLKGWTTHLLDTALLVLGPASEVTAFEFIQPEQSTTAGRNAPLIGAVIRHANGLAVISAHPAFLKKDAALPNSVELTTSLGHFSWRLWVDELEMIPLGGSLHGEWEPIHGPWIYGRMAALHDFILAVRHGGAPGCTLAAAIEVVRLAIGMGYSAATRSTVQLDDDLLERIRLPYAIPD